MEYIKKEIMQQSRHQFIYGNNGSERQKLLRELETDFPIVANADVPMAIYMNNYSLPEINKKRDDIDKVTVSIVSRNFIAFSIIENILEKVLNSNINISSDNISDFIKRINTCFIRDESKKVKDLPELLKTIKESRKAFYDYYGLYTSGEENLPSINDLSITFIDPVRVVELIKAMLNNNSYFGIIVDQQEVIPNISQKAINCFVTSRCNADISMKIACDIDEWNTYFDLNGTLAESIHDYGDVDFDDNQNNHIKKLVFGWDD